jgi:hypothetical protein
VARLWARDVAMGLLPASGGGDADGSGDEAEGLLNEAIE